jgi:acyl-coenzyme A thioesterase PaaI-like protein
MEMHQVRYFLAVARTFNFTRAADECNVTQRHAGFEMEVIDKGRAITHLPFRPEGLNHIGTQHAGALFTVGQAASGAAMAGMFAPILLEIWPVAAEAAIRFLAVAKGPVRAEAQVEGNADDLVAAVNNDGKSEFQVAVNLTGEDGAKIAEMTVDWMKRS